MFRSQHSPSPASVSSRASPGLPAAPRLGRALGAGSARLLNTLLRATPRARPQALGDRRSAPSTRPATPPAAAGSAAQGWRLRRSLLHFPGGRANRSSSGICGMDTTVFLLEITRGTEAPALLPGAPGVSTGCRSPTPPWGRPFPQQVASAPRHASSYSFT